MKKLTKVLCLVLALVCLFALTSCGGYKGPTPRPEIDEAEYYARSEELYESILGEFAQYANAANEEKIDLAKRYALFAQAEAKFLASAAYLPGTARGGNYAISRVAPNTVTNVLYGNDQNRFHQAVIVKGDPITSEDRAEMKAKFGELKGTGTYEAWVKEFLTSKGYELTDEYLYTYNTDPVTWDVFGTSLAADSEAIVNTIDGLMEYDIEGVLQPALATGYEVSEDGKTYTFHIRKGVQWVDYQGKELGEEVTAESWVYGMQHLLDSVGGLEFLVGDDYAGIVNADNYLNGKCEFSEVGVKAVDKYTLQYTLNAPCPFFVTILGYNPMSPLCKSFFESHGGVFGTAEFKAQKVTDAYTFGKDSENIAYCGPYLVTNHTASSVIKFEANPAYWNKDKINIHTLVWNYNDGSDVTKAYTDMKAGTLAGCGLNASTLVMAKEDGWFEKYGYVSAIDATSFGTFVNIDRRYYGNFTDEAVLSHLTVEEAERSNLAVKNVHFRRALAHSLDRAAYNAASVGEELKLASLINSYTPGTFVQLPEATSIVINGVEREFAKGTYYGEIIQAQLDADGVKIKAWDPTADSGAGSSAGYDGYYNPEEAVKELNKAIEELKAQGVEISEKNPIILELPTYVASATYLNRSNAYKQSVEEVLGGKVIIELTECNTASEWYNAGYYTTMGYEANYHLYDCSGWGPDFGDPSTYVNTMIENGYMIHCLGIFGIH